MLLRFMAVPNRQYKSSYAVNKARWVVPVVQFTISEVPITQKNKIEWHNKKKQTEPILKKQVFSNPNERPVFKDSFHFILKKEELDKLPI
jgi:hypothetical protein